MTDDKLVLVKKMVEGVFIFSNLFSVWKLSSNPIFLNGYQTADL